MKFTKTVKFLGIEERKMKDGRLFAVTFFADGTLKPGVSQTSP